MRTHANLQPCSIKLLRSLLRIVVYTHRSNTVSASVNSQGALAQVLSGWLGDSKHWHYYCEKGRMHTPTTAHIAYLAQNECLVLGLTVSSMLLACLVMHRTPGCCSCYLHRTGIPSGLSLLPTHGCCALYRASSRHFYSILRKCVRMRACSGMMIKQAC